jgi:hypothetical protein
LPPLLTWMCSRPVVSFAILGSRSMNRSRS